MFVSSVEFPLRRSAAKLSYANAQNVIEGKGLADVTISPEHDAFAIERDIKLLQVRQMSAF